MEMGPEAREFFMSRINENTRSLDKDISSAEIKKRYFRSSLFFH